MVSPLLPDGHNKHQGRSDDDKRIGKIECRPSVSVRILPNDEVDHVAIGEPVIKIAERPADNKGDARRRNGAFEAPEPVKEPNSNDG